MTTDLWVQAAVWLGLALAASVLSVWLRLATALSEIVVGMVAQMVIGIVLAPTALGQGSAWITFLSSTGAVMLTFLAGAELDPATFKENWRQAGAIGLVSFALPFVGCAALAFYGLHWSVGASWLAGIAMSTTSVAVVYAVMLEFGLNRTSYGKIVLAACFITDLATVVALGLMFSPFTLRTGVFIVVSAVVLPFLPRVVRSVFRRLGGRPSEIEAKFLLTILFALAALATWAGSESVLPAYLVGMVLAGVVGRDHALIRRLRTLTFGLLTPFYFLRAGSLVSVSALVTAPLALLSLLGAKVGLKMVGVYPVARRFGSPRKESAYTTLLMSTGLTFGTIAALFGLNHNVVTTEQYSLLVAAVIGSAVVPTLVANAVFLPRHLLPKAQGRVGRPEVTESKEQS